MIRASLRKVGIYWYILPTYAQGKKVIFDGMDNNGIRFIDYIPKQVITSINSQEMKIKLVNGSLIQIVGSDNVDSLVGANPIGCIFSEYALTDPRAYPLIRPMLTANDGWCILISTPRGKNDLHRLWRIAQDNPKTWFSLKMTVDDTKHIPIEYIEQEIAQGEMSRDLALQEYWTSFDLGVEGAYYSRYLDDMRIKGQISNVPWEPAHKVHTAWDLGMRDATSIIFFQTIGTSVRIIDCYQNTDVGLEHYAKYLQSKPYTYGKHIAPHDIQVRELGTGLSRLEKARHLGIRFTVAPNLSIEDGIEAVRTTLPKTYIDQTNAKQLVDALENYRKEFDDKNKVYKPRPLHNKFSHMADAMRYLAVSLPKTRDSMTQEDMDKIKQEALYGNEPQFAPVFQQPTVRY